MKSLFALLFAFAFVVCANAADVPTPAADGTVSVLKSDNPAPATTSASACCGDTFKEVKLGPWQARRLQRQADRQEARAARECCCKDSCDNCCKKKPTALVLERNKCNCNCR